MNKIKLNTAIDVSPIKIWFSNVSFDDMITLLVLLCAVDLLATIQTVGSGMMNEGNALANMALQQYGIFGLITLKFISTLLAVYILDIAYTKKPSFTLQALWIANLTLGFIALYHSVLLLGIMIS
jgi:hypothetical protein